MITQGSEDRGQRIVRHLDDPSPPVLVGDCYPERPGPARELCASCHRTSLPERPLAPAEFQPQAGQRSLKRQKDAANRGSQAITGRPDMKHPITIPKAARRAAAVIAVAAVAGLIAASAAYAAGSSGAALTADTPGKPRIAQACRLRLVNCRG